MATPSDPSAHYRTPVVDPGRCPAGSIDDVAETLAVAEGKQFRANLVPDAHIAALAVEHGLVLYSTDGDFARFDGLDWINPLK